MKCKLTSFLIGLSMVLACVGIASSEVTWPDPKSEWRESGDTIDVSDNHGGLVSQYDALWSDLAAQGKKVRVVGNCISACTTLLGHIPRDRICVTRNGAFGFHLAQTEAHTAIMWNDYAADIQSWIAREGGLTPELKWMAAPDTYRYFKRCKAFKAKL